jgi:sucrose-6-phosphate hydrolase SacC (GH32 family)
MMKKTKKLIWAVALCAAGMSTMVYAADESALKDAVRVLDAANGVKLKPEGEVRTGVPLEGDEKADSVKRGGDGLAAEFDGGWIDVPLDAIKEQVPFSKDWSLFVRFKSRNPGWVGSLISRKSIGPEASFDLSSWMVQPWGIRRFGFVGEGQLMVGTPQGLRGHLRAALVHADAAPVDGQWCDAVVRQRGDVLELFVNGKLRERRTAKSQAARSYADLFMFAPDAVRIGADPYGEAVFTGRIDEVAFWPRSVTDEEIRQLSGGALDVTWAGDIDLWTRATFEENTTTAQRHIMAQGYFPVAMPEKERLSQIQWRFPEFLRWHLQNNPWFPRIHPGLPLGMQFDTRCLYFNGWYHLFPTWRTDMGLIGYGRFFMAHLASRDLVQWELLPFPGSSLPDGMEIFNGHALVVDGQPSLLSMKAGAPAWLIGEGEKLVTWRLAPQQPVFESEGAGYSGRFDICAFKDGAEWFMTGCRRNEQYTDMVMPLYASKDFVNWTYSGPMLATSAGHSFNECAQAFRVDGKLVITAFYPFNNDPKNSAVGNNYAVGSFFNRTFTPEAWGCIDNGGHGHLRSMTGTVDGRDRVVCWNTIDVYSQVDARETQRQGVKGKHTLPRETFLQKDGKLGFRPVEELALLRRSLQTSSAGKPLPQPQSGEWELELDGSQPLNFTLELAQGGLVAMIQADAAKGVLSVDLSNAKKVGFSAEKPSGYDASDCGKRYEMPLKSAHSLRLFWDRSILEIYSPEGDTLTTTIFYPDPSALALNMKDCGDGFSAKLHTLGSIWENYLKAHPEK